MSKKSANRYNRIYGAIDRIQLRYDGDHDLIPDAPMVLWAEFELACAIKEIADELADLRVLLTSHQDYHEHEAFDDTEGSIE